MSGDRSVGAPSVAARTVRGAIWSYSSYVGGRLLVLASTAVLARLLAPSQFGVVAVALSSIVLLEALGDLGLNQALIVSDASDLDEHADTVFISSVGVGVLLSALAAGVGPLAASFFHQHTLTTLIPVLGLNFLLRSFGNTHFALAQREIDFRKRTYAEFFDVVSRGLTGIGLALAGAGAWSLVIGYLAGTTTRGVVAWTLVRWRPTLRLRRRHIPGLLRFGGPLAGVNVLAAVGGNVDNVLIGRVLGSTALGFYSLAFRLPELIVLNLALVAGEALFPAFAALGRSAIGTAFVKSLRYTLMVVVPAAVGLAVLATPVMLALFGSKWRVAADPMRVLAVYGLAVTLGIPAGTAYKTVGRPDIALKLAIPRIAVLVAAIVLLVHHGIVAVAGAQAGAAAIFDLIGIWVAKRVLNVAWADIGSAFVAPVLAGAAMAGVMIVVRDWLGAPVPTLIAASIAGLVAYLGSLMLLDRTAMREALGLLRGRLRSRGTTGLPDPAQALETEVARSPAHEPR